MGRSATLALGAVAIAAFFLLRRDHPGTGAEGGDVEADGGVGILEQAGNILNDGKLSPDGLAMIERFESFSATPYPDYKGMSIGYGHLIKAGESLATVTPELAAQMLGNDVAWAEAVVNNSVSVALSQEQFDALVSLAFNIGEDAFKKSTLVRLLNSGDYQGAAAQFDRWNHAGGQVLQALTDRRAAERELFQGGIST